MPRSVVLHCMVPILSQSQQYALLGWEQLTVDRDVISFHLTGTIALVFVVAVRTDRVIAQVGAIIGLSRWTSWGCGVSLGHGSEGETRRLVLKVFIRKGSRPRRLNVRGSIPNLDRYTWVERDGPPISAQCAQARPVKTILERYQELQPNIKDLGAHTLRRKGNIPGTC